MPGPISILEEFDGAHLLATFAVFVVAGFLIVYADQYIFSKVESALSIPPTQF